MIRIEDAAKDEQQQQQQQQQFLKSMLPFFALAFLFLFVSC